MPQSIFPSPKKKRYSSSLAPVKAFCFALSISSSALPATGSLPVPLSLHRIAVPAWQKKTRCQRPLGAVNLPVMFSDSIRTFCCLCFSQTVSAHHTPLFKPLILKASLSPLQNKWREHGLLSKGKDSTSKQRGCQHQSSPEQVQTATAMHKPAPCGCQRREAGSLLTPQLLPLLQAAQLLLFASGDDERQRKRLGPPVRFLLSKIALLLPISPIAAVCYLT